ncbi:hypothetical protein CSAL01_00240 [Colletotrichum salicis]|uniref:WW domain-containing protein n=1 Tax=Colletotrichum salicis TaxID=1209931 RepID=A0A135V784_9PEZI|nr:hypothetical protein CSAL01_00240 [Colletotrichum salicis]
MAALPTGWEWDYDGSRWLYRYKPNGHEQFHFPKEGDEFPDFVDCFSPAPELAPEEKLESQQQLKRRTTADANPTSQMRATGGPVSDFGMSRSGFGGPMGNDDDGSDGFFFQPENFIYLGPGAYDDISPEADEDEREDALGKPGVGEGGRGNSNKNYARLDVASIKSGVSPLQSETNTPSIINSVPVRGAEAVSEAPAEMMPAEQPLNINTDTNPDPNQALPPAPGVPLLDSVEKPRPGYSASFQRPPWDPVGTMAEMATEHTAPAHIETHPDPVEMADTAILAPIETNFADLGIAELPERTSPAEARPQPPTQSTHDLLHQTNMSDAALYGATFGTGSRPQNSSPSRKSQVSQESRRDSATGITTPDHSLPEVVPQPAPQPTQSPSPGAGGSGPFTIKRKPSKSAGKQTQYQPYVPGVVSSAPSEKSSATDYKRREHRNSLARDGSLMMGPRTKFDQTSMPSVLKPPQLPPKLPIDASQAPSPPANDQRALNPASQTSGPATQGPLQHFPSVLKPARGQPQNRAQDPSPPQSASVDISSKKEKGKEVQYAAFQPGLASQKGLQPQGPDVQRPKTTPIQSSQNQYRMLSQNDRLPATNTPPAPAFLQRPWAQSDIRQQPLSSGQQRASIDYPLDGTQRHDSIPDGGRPRQTSYASSEVSSLEPPTGSQSSVPLQTPSPLESEGRRHSSGFFQGGNSNSYSSQSGAGFGTAGLRTASISGPSPPLTAMETARQASRPAENQVPPARPGKFPVSIVAMAHPNQVMESQTFGETWTPSSNRRHSLPSGSMADEVALPVSQQLQPEKYELSDQYQGQVQLHFDSVHWETSGTSAAEAAHGISRPFSVHPTGMQAGQSGGPPSGPKPPITSQPPHPTEENRQSGNRPSCPTVTLPSQSALGPMSPSTPIRSPGHLLHPIHEHNEIDNVMNTASATPGAGNPSDTRGYPYGSSPHFSSASNPAHYPVANNPPLHQSPANIAGLPQSSRMRPGSTPPVMQHSANGKEKGGWLSKFKKGGSSKSTVLQKAPPPQQGIPIQLPLQPAPPPQGLMTRNPMTAGVPTDLKAGQQAMPVMSRQPNNVPNVQYTSFAPSRNSASSDSHAVAQNTSSIQQAPIRQNHLAQSNASLVPGPMPQPTSQAQQHHGVGEQLQQRSTSVPPGGLALSSGSPMDQMDNLSDAASVSTMDVSEAQAQPVLRPQLVTVERHVAVQPNREQPAVQSASYIPQSARPTAEGHPAKALGDSELIVQPLFAKSQTQTTISAVPVNQTPVSQNKWAKKPAVDYSGDDWGDDPWDYQ